MRVPMAAFCFAAAIAAAQSRAPERASLETLLTRAAWYLDYFIDQFENVVAEETYIQDASIIVPSFNPAAGRGAVAPQTSAAEMSRARHRDLRSDLLLVRLPGSADLVPFRDVLVVDGVAVQVEPPSVRAIVTTTFRYDERFGIAVPMEMRERYTIGTGNRVNTVATYRRFRRFDVMADENVRMRLETVTEPVTGMTLVGLPAGRFTMGSASSETGRNADETIHDVDITRPFFLGRYEVTQQEWLTVMGAAPSHFAACGPHCPVENVTFYDVEQFLSKLNERDAGSSITLKYRLPTEAEWEYACRAGTTGPFATGENITTDQANYNGRFPYATFAAGAFRQRPTAVGSFPPNRWGLADMHGNVWEWTSDWYGPYPEGNTANIDPSGPDTGDRRVIRGGSWYFDGNSARCALRYTHAPKDRGFSLGFRLAADRR